MKIIVNAKTNANKTLVKQIDDLTYEVYVTGIPEKGKANSAIIDALSKYFKKPKSLITINAGHKNKNKIVEISD